MSRESCMVALKIELIFTCRRHTPKITLCLDLLAGSYNVRSSMCPVFDTVKSIIILWIQNLDVTLKRWQPRAWLKAPHNYLLFLVFAYRFNKEFSSRMKNKSSQQKEKWWCWLGRNGLCLQVHSFAGNPLSLQHPNHTCWTRRAVQALRYLTTYWKNSKMEMSSSSIVFLKQCFYSRTISKSRTGALWVPVALAPAANSLHVREALLSTHWYPHAGSASTQTISNSVETHQRGDWLAFKTKLLFPRCSWLQKGGLQKNQVQNPHQTQWPSWSPPEQNLQFIHKIDAGCMQFTAQSLWTQQMSRFSPGPMHPPVTII